MGQQNPDSIRGSALHHRAHLFEKARSEIYEKMEKRKMMKFVEPTWLQKGKEIKAYGRVLFQRANQPDKKIVIFGQGRSGSQLFCDLLNSHPEIHCEMEILGSKVIFSEAYIQGRSIKFAEKIYGFKVKIYQLTKMQKIDPHKFLLNVDKKGWKIIHLRRENILRQAIYSMILEIRKITHDRYVNPLKGKKIYIDCDRLLFKMEQREQYASEEKLVLEKLSYITVVYEKDLLFAENHQNTCNRIFDYLGISSVPVKTKLVKTTSNQMSDFIENYEELVAAVSKTRYAKFLSKE